MDAAASQSDDSLGPLGALAHPGFSGDENFLEGTATPVATPGSPDLGGNTDEVDADLLVLGPCPERGPTRLGPGPDQ